MTRAHLSPNNWRCCILLLTILSLHAALLAYSAAKHSPVIGEVNHLPAGLSHLCLGRFDLFRVNPPLVRTVAAVPVALMSPKTDWRRYDPSPLDRHDLDVSQDFLRINGTRALSFFTVARWACIPFSILGGYICYRWARELYGTGAGFLALTLWCFCPFVLGHSSLFTPDAHAAAMGVTASYTFWCWLVRSNFTEAIVSGVVLGLAELTKFTLLVLYPLWILMWLIYKLPRYGTHCRTHWLREAAMVAGMICLSIIVINLGYEFEGSFSPIGEYQFQSRLFAGTLPDVSQARVTGNRFASTWIASLPTPLPANYLQGIDTQRLDFERGLPSYLSGEWSNRGWWYYYLYALVIKIPVGTWCLIGLALWATVFRLDNSTSLIDEAIVFIPLLIILIFLSSQNGFSAHSRYIVPALPFLYIWTSKVALLCKMRSVPIRRAVLSAIVAVSLIWSVGSSLWSYPHSLSYFNELVGGPMGGHRHLLNSNMAWGQDLYYLKSWYDDHPKARPFYLAYYGLLDPKLAGIDFNVPPMGPSIEAWRSGRPVERLRPLSGWYAIDMNHLHGAALATPDGQGGWQRVTYDGFDLSCFLLYKPVATAGYSIYIYHFTADDVN